MTKALPKADQPKDGAAQRQTIRVGGRAVPLVLKANKRARRLILKVDPITREVTLTSPSARGFSRAIAFARANEGWIAARLNALPPPVPFVSGAVIPVRGVPHEICHETGGKGGLPVYQAPACAPAVADLPLFAGSAVPARLMVRGDAAHISRRVTDWLRQAARRDLTQATLAHAAAFGTAPARVCVRDTASRWGSCSTSRVINFSWRLIFAPPYALDYVAAHEAAHLIEHNHGPNFWKLVRARIDDIAGAKRWLAENGAALHCYGAAPISSDTATHQ